ncbi:MAG: neutral/alkaline non-lysosomal ceramidase N-terminal domain-containing protein [Kiritimatiellae bacterium]|nr:neutral/alkaline non-lysosomal ceramidase N-terminal domain-containing protein [Kiritimatiellia bacterium]
MSELVVGYGETDITPPMGVELSGYGFYRGRRAETVLDHLKVRAIVVLDETSALTVVACDLVGFSIEFSDRVRAAIAAEHGWRMTHVLLACTHTHSGPAVMPLRGCGEFADQYAQGLPNLIAEAVRRAVADVRPAQMLDGSETVEPIGVNRRNRRFDEIDPVLQGIVFRRSDELLFLLNYACHGVVLGPDPAVSADWPGALIAALERRGHRGLFLQGFCGDIDPVCNLNRWGKGTADDLTHYGELLTHHALNISRYGRKLASVSIRAKEVRIALPLAVPASREELRRERQSLTKGKTDQGLNRFAEDWLRQADAEYEARRDHPFIDDVPIAGIFLGDVPLLALPAEVFCRYGLELRKRWPNMMAVGYANGNAGYWPTAHAYETAGDYSCYLAPKAYHGFPYHPGIESLVREASERALSLAEKANIRAASKTHG